MSVPTQVEPFPNLASLNWKDDETVIAIVPNYGNSFLTVKLHITLDTFTFAATTSTSAIIGIRGPIQEKPPYTIGRYNLADFVEWIEAKDQPTAICLLLAEFLVDQHETLDMRFLVVSLESLDDLIGAMLKAIPNGVSQRKRRSAMRAGMTLSGGTSWPVYDEKHALIALRYMAMGRGDTTQYGKYLRKLFRLYPKADYPRVNRLYKQLRDDIEDWM